MKPNPERNWSIQLWGANEGEYHAVNMRGTIEAALGAADETECAVDWEVVRVTLTIRKLGLSQEVTVVFTFE